LGRRRGSTRFFSGDWALTGELLSSKGFGGHYDVILTSEGIYNQDSQWRLLECIKQVCGGGRQWRMPAGSVGLWDARKARHLKAGGAVQGSWDTSVWKPSVQGCVRRGRIWLGAFERVSDTPMTSSVENTFELASEIPNLLTHDRCCSHPTPLSTSRQRRTILVWGGAPRHSESSSRRSVSVEAFILPRVV